MLSPSLKKLKLIANHLRISSACGSEFLVALILFLQSAPCQTLDRDTTTEQNEIREENILESLLSYSDDISGINERVDLNSATPEELLLIPGMTMDVASSIVAYRKKVGLVRDIDELSGLEGVTPELLSSLKRSAGIAIEDKLSSSAASYASFSPEKTSLFESAYHEGGIKNFQKVQLNLYNFELNCTTDKDAGEKSYLDFYSASLAVRDVSIFSVLEIGDFSLSLGNGMLFSNPGIVSKSAGPISPLFIRSAYSLKPYCSRSENGFLRGGAFAVPLGNIAFTGFASSKNLFAHLDQSGRTVSIDRSGLNLPTNSNVADLKENITGGVVRFDAPFINCGASAAYFSYDRPFASFYSQSQLAGESFVRLQSHQTAFSGELLVDRVVSFSTNFQIDMDEAGFALGVRNLRSRLTPNYSGAFAESFPSAPEQGIYFGTSISPAKIVKMGFYYDRFKIMSTTGNPDKSGEEVFLDSDINLNHVRILEGSATVIYLRYRYKTNEDFYVPETEFPAAQSTLTGNKQNLRIDFRHNFSRLFSIRARFEKNFLSSGEEGELFLFDAAWSGEVVSVNSRICSYKTDSYNSAFYEVERDLPGVGLYSLFYEDGSHFSLMMMEKITKSLSAGEKILKDLYNGTRKVTVGSVTALLPGATFISLELNYQIK